MHTRGGFARMIQSYLDRAVAAGAIAPQDTVTISWAWFGAINEIVVRWLATDEPRGYDEALPTLRVILLRSIGAPVRSQPTRSKREVTMSASRLPQSPPPRTAITPTLRAPGRDRLPQRGAGL